MKITIEIVPLNNSWKCAEEIIEKIISSEIEADEIEIVVKQISVNSPPFNRGDEMEKELTVFEDDFQDVCRPVVEYIQKHYGASHVKAIISCEYAELVKTQKGVPFKFSDYFNRGEKMEKFDEWSDAELEELENLCAPLVKYLQTNHKRCNPFSAVIVMWDSVIFAGGEGGNIYFPFKVPD